MKTLTMKYADIVWQRTEDEDGDPIWSKRVSGEWTPCSMQETSDNLEVYMVENCDNLELRPNRK